VAEFWTLGGFDIVPFLQLPMLTLALAVHCSHAVLIAAAVLVVGRRRIQRVSAAVFLVCAFILEWFAPVDSFWRAILALGGMMASMATIKIAATAKPQWSARYRLLHLLTLGYRCVPGASGRFYRYASLAVLSWRGWLVARPSCSSGI
jgi:hypothetical protein